MNTRLLRNSLPVTAIASALLAAVALPPPPQQAKWAAANDPAAKYIIDRERPTDALIHQGEAVVRERFIIHRIIPGGGNPSAWILR